MEKLKCGAPGKSENCICFCSPSQGSVLFLFKSRKYLYTYVNVYRWDPQCLFKSHSELQSLIFLSYIQLESKESQTTLKTLITLKTLTTLKNFGFLINLLLCYSVMLLCRFGQKCYIKVFATAGGNYNPFIRYLWTSKYVPL